ncbi:hypothetical protein KUTG_10157 [Kutzneria sp. 744]|nr:hypothetical protein KUTG_10157 [Kutzneria sp. 744]
MIGPGWIGADDEDVVRSTTLEDNAVTTAIDANKVTVPSSAPADHLRDVVSLVVPKDSPLGRVALSVDDLASHVPPHVTDQTTCPLCSHPWPCPRWAQAARQIHGAGVQLMDMVPRDLHTLVWPPTTDIRSA